MDKLAENLQKLTEDNLLTVVQMIHDNKTEETYTKNDVDRELFNSPMYPSFPLYQCDNTSAILANIFLSLTKLVLSIQKENSMSICTPYQTASSRIFGPSRSRNYRKWLPFFSPDHHHHYQNIT